MKKVLGIFTIIFAVISGFALADDDISIIPKGDTTNAAQKVEQVSSGGKVWETYRDIVDNGDLSLGDQLASGIMSRDTILDYCVYLAKFLGELALLLGAMAIIFMGYKRIFRNLKPQSDNPLGKIILGLLIIIFAYAIVKLIWSAFIS